MGVAGDWGKAPVDGVGAELGTRWGLVVAATGRWLAGVGRREGIVGVRVWRVTAIERLRGASRVV